MKSAYEGQRQVPGSLDSFFSVNEINRHLISSKQ